MSEYTITVYELEKAGFFKTHPLEYPIFSEDYRETLNNAILSHYRFREIGFQNPNQWIDRLNTRLSRIMEDKFNLLFELKKTDFNPLYNIDLTEEFSHDINSSGKSNNNTTNNTNNNSLNFSGAYPNEELLREELGDSIFADASAHSKENSTDESRSNSKEDSNMKETYIKKTKGSSAGLSFGHALLQAKQFAEKYDLINQILKNISDLFLNVW